MPNEVLENVNEVAEVAKDIKDTNVNGWMVVAGITSAIALGEAVHFIIVPKIKEVAKNLKQKSEKRKKETKKEEEQNTESEE